jgi:hypothetical protein
MHLFENKQLYGVENKLNVHKFSGTRKRLTFSERRLTNIHFVLRILKTVHFTTPRAFSKQKIMLFSCLTTCIVKGHTLNFVQGSGGGGVTDVLTSGDFLYSYVQEW